MNWLFRNIAVMIFGAMTSLATVGYLLYFEAVNGVSIFSYSGADMAHLKIISHLPVGAIFAGLAGSVGYLIVALLLRVRPANIVMFVMLGVSGLVVYMAQSAQMELLMGARGMTTNTKTFGRFLFTSTIHSPVHYWSTEDDSSFTYASSSSPGSSSSAPRIAPTGDAQADGISSGVSGMLASQDASKAGPVKQLNQMGNGVDNITSGVSAHGTQWLLALIQTLGFAIGSLVVFFHLRSLTHCADCMRLLSIKGERTRYYLRGPEMRNSVDEFLNRAREKQLQEAIQAHMGRGSDRRTKWAEYFSTLEISRCRQCDGHRLQYRTFRKEGTNWKDIPLMGFVATTMEKLDFVS